MTLEHCPNCGALTRPEDLRERRCIRSTCDRTERLREIAAQKYLRIFNARKEWER